MRPSYDPVTRTATIPDDASPYCRAHELAHAAQQQHATRCWRLHQRCRSWPYLARLTLLLVEWQAANLALAVLDRIGRSDRAARSEARRDKWQYLVQCFGI